MNRYEILLLQNKSEKLTTNERKRRIEIIIKKRTEDIIEYKNKISKCKRVISKLTKRFQEIDS